VSRIWVTTGDVVAPSMAGPAIRAWQIASALAADHHDVRLTSTTRVEGVNPDGFTAMTVSGEAEARTLEAWCDVVVFQGDLLERYPFVATGEKVLVADVYDPFHIEQLEQTRDLELQTRRIVVYNAIAAADTQLLRGDFFVCASDKQRDFWLGHLAALGRINHVSYDADPSLRSLIGLAPFGIPAEPPRQSRHGIKGAVPGITADDKVLLWGGGIYNWFDPLTLIRAVDALRRDDPRVKLFFLGMQHPHPDVKEMSMAVAARELADTLGLRDSHVFFNEKWVAYDDRHNYLLDADLGVSTHVVHLETAFAFRTRMLDYLWARLPIVCTRGDTFGDLVASEGLGLVVEPSDVDALAEALRRALGDEELRASARERMDALAPRYHWDSALAELVAFCRAPHRAADLLDPHVGPMLQRKLGALERPLTGWRRDVALAKEYFREGGVRQLATKVRSRLSHGPPPA
jgi:glycosyltransferase involved in cell wall biosynthesis